MIVVGFVFAVAIIIVIYILKKKGITLKLRKRDYGKLIKSERIK